MARYEGDFGLACSSLQSQSSRLRLCSELHSVQTLIRLRHGWATDFGASQTFFRRRLSSTSESVQTQSLFRLRLCSDSDVSVQPKALLRLSLCSDSVKALLPHDCSIPHRENRMFQWRISGPDLPRSTCLVRMHWVKDQHNQAQWLVQNLFSSH